VHIYTNLQWSFHGTNKFGGRIQSSVAKKKTGRRRESEEDNGRESLSSPPDMFAFVKCMLIPFFASETFLTLNLLNSEPLFIRYNSVEAFLFQFFSKTILINVYTFLKRN
jgi:hypothetical protein